MRPQVTKYLRRAVESEGPGGGDKCLPPPQFLADQLSLYQPWPGVKLCSTHY